jgi:hypothetical protein
VSDAPRHEHVVVRDDMGLPDHDSLEERINRAEHDAGMPVGGLGRRSHCWLCRRASEVQS